MNPDHLGYLKNQNIVWFNPCWGYYGFWKRLNEFRQEKKLDFQSAWLDRRMKRNKELYAAALVALLMRKDAPQKNGWWFTKPPSPQDPPDGVIATILESPQGNIISVREIEVVEYFNGLVLNVLKNKMEGKSYEPNTALVCLLSPTVNQVLDFINISRRVQELKFPLEYIFCVFHGFMITSLPRNPVLQDLIQTTLIQIAPEYVPINLSPHISCTAWRGGTEQSWLRFSCRGKNKTLQKVTDDSLPKLFD